MRDYVRGKGWVGAKDGKPVNPTTGQPRVFQQVNCPECKERITVEVLGVPPAADAGPRQPREHIVNPATTRCVMCGRNAFQRNNTPMCDYPVARPAGSRAGINNATESHNGT